jgi:uncharacterized repeat protein (TIGR01451 family)
MFCVGQAAVSQPPVWSVQAEMNSYIDPNTFIPQDQGEFAPLRAEILTQPAWGDTFLTPGAAPETGGDTEIEIMGTVLATASPLATATLPATQLVTPTASLIPTNTAIPTSTIYYPPPPTNTKKPSAPPADAPPADTPVPSPSADLSITKDNGSTSYTPGSAISPYTITVTNSGTSANNVTGATVTDNFDTSILSSISWTCAPTGAGASCTASGSGNISDTVNLPIGTSVIYTVNANTSGSATTNLTNTASVSLLAGMTDPTPGNNSNNDTPDVPNIVTPSADLSITKDDWVTTYAPNGSVTYSIVVSNAGPSDVTGATVTDTFPANISSASWTCAATGGASCVASGSGDINDSVNLPIGDTVTYTVTAIISSTATGPLSNTATIAVPGGVIDPNLVNNSDTDVDLDSATLPSCDATIDVAGTGTVNNIPGGVVTCLRFTDAGLSEGAIVSLDGHPNVFVRWSGLDQNLSGSCGNHEKIFASASETLPDIGIDKNGEIILYVIAEKKVNLDITSIADWSTGCP